MIVSNSIVELRRQIRDDLRVQHPEWVEPNGGCPKCDSYESRLAELLESSSPSRTGIKLNRHAVAGLTKSAPQVVNNP